MPAYARTEAASFGRCLVMPNTLPPIASAEAVVAYRAAILNALGATGGAGPKAAAGAAAHGLEPLMTFKLLPGMSAETVRACAAAGAIAGKYYPAGATTNSSDGVRHPDEIEEALAAMEEADVVLSIHGEDPEAPVLEREAAFLPTLSLILARHPRLRIVLEHLSSAEGLAFVLAGPDRLAGSVTAHHLLFSLDDLMGEGLDPHLYCKPVVKLRSDRDALRAAVFSIATGGGAATKGGDGAPKLFFGSDSAPHPRAAKEGARAASGIWSAPTALPALVGLFAEAGALDALPAFLCERGAAFYRLPPPTGEVILVEEAWQVPEEIDGAVPMLHGKRLGWRVA
jgi:dihydroorotase